MKQLIIENLECIHVDHQSKDAVILLHGYGANMHDLVSLSQVIGGSKNFDWYFPNAPIDLAMMMPFMQSRAWFPIDMEELQRAQMQGGFRDFKKPAKEDFYIALYQAQKFLDQILVSYNRVILGGFSQGAMIASHLGMINSAKLSGLLIYSGVLIDEIKFDTYQCKQPLKIVQSHGVQDPILDYKIALDLHDKMLQKGHQVDFVEFHGGHEIPQKVIEQSSILLSSLA